MPAITSPSCWPAKASLPRPGPNSGRSSTPGCAGAGPGHPLTLTTRHEIRRTLAAQGKPAEAGAPFRQVLDARLRVLGPDHPDTLTMMNTLKALDDKDP